MHKTTNTEGHVFKESSTSEWKDFQAFIDHANKYCNWLVLRNFEYLPNDFFENDKDVDVLCEDLDVFVQSMKLTKRTWGTAAYETTIDNKVVFFDVRFLGDNYYDKLWQYHMLTNKIYTDQGVPRLSDVDYFYSLLYHSKLQKLSIKGVYKPRLVSLAHTIGLVELCESDLKNDQATADLLSQFMERNKYVFCHPADINVPQNKKFFRYLKPALKQGKVQPLPKEILVRGLILKVAVRVIPRTIKNWLKKLF